MINSFLIAKLNKTLKANIMKNILKLKTLLLVGFIALVALSSCKKDADEITQALTASMSAKINSIDEIDTTIITSSKDWTAISRISIMKGEVLTITGTELNLTTLPDVLNVTIYGTTEGTYKLGLNVASAQCGCVLSTKYNDANVTFTSTSGTVVLTKVDKTAQLISGTYEFWLYSGGVWKTITNGKFENLKYEVK